MMLLSMVKGMLARLFTRIMWMPNPVWVLFRCLVLSKPRTRSSPSLSTNTMLNDELYKLYHSSAGLSRNADTHPLFCKKIALVAPDTIVKVGRQPEAANTDFVRANTDIPVPLCERHFAADDNGDGYLVMEYIPGKTLTSCWAELSWWMRFRVIISLHDYIRQLSHLRHMVPGPLSEDGSPQTCRGPLFGEEAGPFEDYASMSAFFNYRMRVMKIVKPKAVAGLSESFDDEGPLVFSHLDLHLDNILLGEDGQLWLLDWFFPVWFEYAAMKAYVWRQPASFNRYIPFITGYYDGPGQTPFVHGIGWALRIKHIEPV